MPAIGSNQAAGGKMTEAVIFWMLSLPWILNVALITVSDLPQQEKLTCYGLDMVLFGWTMLAWRILYGDYFSRERNAEAAALLQTGQQHQRYDGQQAHLGVGGGAVGGIERWTGYEPNQNNDEPMPHG